MLALVEDGSRGDEVDRAGLERVFAGLREYASRSEEAIAQLERQLAQARGLRLRLGEQLARSELLLERRRDG